MQKIFSLLKPNIILCSRIPTQYYHHCNVKSLDNCLFLMLLFWNRYESFGILLLILILGCACDQDSILNTHKGRWSSYNNTRTRKSVSGCCNLVSVLYNWLLWNRCLVWTEWKCEIGVFLSIGRFDMWVSTRSFVLEMLEINLFWAISETSFMADCKASEFHCSIFTTVSCVPAPPLPQPMLEVIPILCDPHPLPVIL